MNFSRKEFRGARSGAASRQGQVARATGWRPVGAHQSANSCKILTLIHQRNIIVNMMRKLKKAAAFNSFLSLYFLFFVGWLQFHHGHDAVDYLDFGDSASRVVVVGAHCHSSEANFPLFENHRIITKSRVDCLLCTFSNWLFLRSPGNRLVSILNVRELNCFPTQFVFQRQSSCTYHLRAPPVTIPS